MTPRASSVRDLANHELRHQAQPVKLALTHGRPTVEQLRMWQNRYLNELIAWGRTTRAKVPAELDIGTGCVAEPTCKLASYCGLLRGIGSELQARTPVCCRGRQRAVPGFRQHDLWPVENVKDFQLLTPGVDAIGIPDPSRSALSAGAHRTACSGFAAPRPRPLASAPSPNPMRPLCA